MHKKLNKTMAPSSAETTTTATEPLTHKALFEENIKKIKFIYVMSEVDHSPMYTWVDRS